jgi:D-xylose transport system substrate-binding protein
MKLSALILILLLLTSQYSCIKTGGSFKAGFLVHTLQDERWAIERDAFTAKVTELGGSVLFDNAEQDERNQYHLAKKMISEGIDVLVLVPVNSKTSASISRLCADNGVKLIAYDIIVENCPLDLYISFDNEKVGEIMAQYAIDKKPGGNYVLFWGDSNMKIAHWIKDGQMKVLQPYIQSGKINLVYSAYIENWNNANSAFLMGKIIDVHGENIDAVIASADIIAQGVIEACDEKAITRRPLLTGQDASQTALQYMREGKQSMTIKKDFTQLAAHAAISAQKLARGEKIKGDTVLYNGYKNIPSVLLPPVLVEQASN